MLQTENEPPLNFPLKQFLVERIWEYNAACSQFSFIDASYFNVGNNREI